MSLINFLTKKENIIVDRFHENEWKSYRWSLIILIRYISNREKVEYTSIFLFTSYDIALYDSIQFERIENSHRCPSKMF